MSRGCQLAVSFKSHIRSLNKNNWPPLIYTDICRGNGCLGHLGGSERGYTAYIVRVCEELDSKFLTDHRCCCFAIIKCFVTMK